MVALLAHYSFNRSRLHKRNTFNFQFQSAHRGAFAQNIYYAIFIWMASFVSVCIGCLNFQKFGLPAIVHVLFTFVSSTSRFIIIIMFLHYRPVLAVLQQSFFSRKPSEEKQKQMVSAKMKKKKIAHDTRQQNDDNNNNNNNMLYKV